MLTDRTVWTLGLAAALAGAGGCGGNEAAFVVDWNLSYVGGGAPGNTPADACRNAGTPTVDLDVRNQASGVATRDSFPCAAFGGQSQELPAGAYDVKITLVNASGQGVSDKLGAWQLVRRSVTDLGIIQFQVQTFVAFWSIARANVPVTCEQAGAKSVKLVTQLPEGQPLSYLFPCGDGGGVTTAIPLGSYSVQVQLTGAGDQVLSETRAMTFPVLGDRRAQLPLITFDVR